MLTLPENFKQKALTALLDHRQNFGGTDTKYARQFGIHPSVFSRLKKDPDNINLLADAKWMEIGQKLNVTTNERQWKTVKTEVFNVIEEQVTFCQKNGKSLMLVDDTGIGKTYTAKYLSRTLKNCFYIDVSQAKSKAEFIRLLARTLGVSDRDRLSAIKTNIKYVLKILPNPVIIIDEAGDLADRTFLEVKEIWNDTEGSVGWYMMGAEGLQRKVERNMNNQKPGFAEIFSRFGERYLHVTPLENQERLNFYKKLLTDVITANIPATARIPSRGKDNIAFVRQIVNKCLRNDSGRISGLRRAETLLLMN